MQSFPFSQIFSPAVQAVRSHREVLPWGTCREMRMRFWSAAVAAGLSVTPAVADMFPAAAPDKVGLSAERLQRITELLGTEVEKGRLPGAVVAVARKGKLAYFEAIGYRDSAAKA